MNENTTTDWRDDPAAWRDLYTIGDHDPANCRCIHCAIARATR